MIGGRTPETCWAVNKRQDNKLENCCIWLVIYLNCTMMHGLKNLNFFYFFDVFGSMNLAIIAGGRIAYFVWNLGLGVETEEPGFSSWQGEEISSSSKHSAWVCGPSSFVFDGYIKVSCYRVKRLHHPFQWRRWECVEVYLHFQTRLHGLLLKYDQNNLPFTCISGKSLWNLPGTTISFMILNFVLCLPIPIRTFSCHSFSDLFRLKAWT